MKQRIFNIVLLAICLFSMLPAVIAQTPNGAGVQPAATVAPSPGAYNPAVKVNYVRTWAPGMPYTDPAQVSNSSRSAREVKQVTQYVDGLGRPLQSVSKKQSPDELDVVVPVRYDEFGREQYQYQPYVSSANTGLFQLNPFAEQKAFLQTQHLNEEVFYSQTVYEASPLNRVLKTMAPGNSWGGNGRGVETKYLFNTTTDDVRIWTIAAAINSVPSSTAAYPVGQLYKNVTVDEHGKQVIEFKDKEGNVVLKKVELTGNADGYSGWLCTYYVYDYLGNLRYVIPPKAVAAIQGTGWSLSDATIRQELCFRYEYDQRNRVIIKQVPGAKEAEMVYDVKDRLVFSRDGNLREKTPHQWLVTFYDDLNRPVMTALYPTEASRTDLQTTMDAVSASSTTLTNTLHGPADLVLGHRDVTKVEYKAGNSIIFQDGFESEVTAEFETFIEPGSGTTQSVTVTNPLPAISGYSPLTYTFYDDYSYPGAHNLIAGDLAIPQPINSSEHHIERATTSCSTTHGLVTGTKVKVLATGEWLTITSYYDEKGRVIQTLADNINHGKDVSSSLYDFGGLLLSTYLHHTNPSSGVTPDSRILTKMSYDAGGRVLNTVKKFNDLAEQTIAVNQYDPLGQLKTKTLGNNLEHLDYAYNVRGWLASINKLYVKGEDNDHYFGQELSYDYGFTSGPLYNGNISGITWKGKKDGIARAYGYNYDAANRLNHAEFSQQNSGSTSWLKNQKDFTTSNITYDENGNIQTMNHQGEKAGAIQPIDQLSYTYLPNTNKLSAVADPYTDPAAGLGDFSNGANSGADYDYDANGNLKQDLNKNIQSGNISYNHLNLPETITITGKGIIRYIYDASGTKHQKIVTDQTVSPERVTTTDYIDGFVYENDTLQFAGHEEGRIRAVCKSGQPVSYYYDYFIKDHLGNIRTVLTEQTDFSMYLASMETTSAAKENALFNNIDASRSAKPAGYPDEQAAAENAYVAKLNANNPDKRIGPSIILRVMTGDTISLGAKAFYKSIGTKSKKSILPVEDMASSLMRAMGQASGAGNPSVHGGDNTNSPLNAGFLGNEYQRLKEKEPGNGQNIDRPKAYLNFVLFDDDLKLVEENSGVKQVKAEPDQLQTLAQGKMVVKKSGFLYVYTSNETAQDVYFDNVTLMHTPGALLEETHYYPFGLTMAGISSKAVMKLENRIKFNGIEHTTDLDINQYDAFYRTLDPQIGRWKQIDPKCEYFEDYSPYNHVLNNPITMSDPWGDDTTHVNDLPEIWPDFNPEQDVVSLNGIVVSPQGSSADWQHSSTTFGWKVMRSRSLFWDILGGHRTSGWYEVTADGILTSRIRSIGGVAPSAGMGKLSNINTVYKGIKDLAPYIGKTINLLKRYTSAEREAMKIVSLFPGASGRLLRAVEQVVLDYQKTLGDVSNKMKALDFDLAKNKGLYEKAVKFLESNYPNWKEIIASSH